MYSASFVRKKILQALRKSVLPTLNSQSVSHLLAEPPFDFTDLQYRVLDSVPLPDIDDGRRQMVHSWPQHKMVSSTTPFLAFIFEGTADVRIGLTEKLASKQPEATRAGIYALRLAAPCALHHPPMVPRGDGSQFIFEGEQELPVSAIYMHIMSDVVLVSMRILSDKESFGTHPLQINDPMMASCALLYADELRHGGHADLAQTLLLLLMQRLNRYLEKNYPQLGNTSWPHQEAKTASPQQPQSHAETLCYQVMQYVQAHLDHKLTRETLAARFKVSAVHLNRVFCQVEGVPVMRYVTQQRITAAKAMLAEANESIEDIAHFVGFSSGASFGTVFRRNTGKSPRAYRYENNKYHGMSENNQFD
jgi:AraC-like DNA-binding protein